MDCYWRNLGRMLVWASLLSCAAGTGCFCFPGTRPEQARFFDTEGTLQNTAVSAATSAAEAAQAATSADYAVLPAVQPRGLEASNSQLQRVAHQQEDLAPQPRSLPEPTDLRKLEPLAP